MNNKILSIILFLTSLVVISSGDDKLGLPVNYTWPLNTKRLCFAARFELKLNVEYTKNDDSKATAVIPLDNSTFESYSVSCAAPSNTHQFVISMLNVYTVIIFNFTVDDKNTTSLTKVTVYLTVDGKQDYITDYSNSTAGSHKFSADESLFESGVDNSFRCDTTTSIKGFGTDRGVTITSIDIDDLHIQPFVDDSKEFSEYNNEILCKADTDKDSNLIPIIVGACLAILVVIVLVAYLIGRRRSRNGYQTV